MTCLKPEGARPGATGADGLDFNAYDRMEPRKPGATPAPFRNGKPVKDANISPAGLYRPDYRVMTPHMRSPEYVQMSTAAAITLGLVEGQIELRSGDLLYFYVDWSQSARLVRDIHAMIKPQVAAASRATLRRSR